MLVSDSSDITCDIQCSTYRNDIRVYTIHPLLVHQGGLIHHLLVHQGGRLVYCKVQLLSVLNYKTWSRPQKQRYVCPAWRVCLVHHTTPPGWPKYYNTLNFAVNPINHEEGGVRPMPSINILVKLSMLWPKSIYATRTSSLELFTTISTTLKSSASLSANYYFARKICSRYTWIQTGIICVRWYAHMSNVLCPTMVAFRLL